MKQLAIIVLLAFLSSTEGVVFHADNRICKFYLHLEKEGFQTLALVGLSQNSPNSTLEELRSLVEQSTATVSACCNPDYHANCSKDGAAMFQSELCASHSLVEKNGLQDCCEMSGSNRTHCFVKHKSEIPTDYWARFQVPAPEQCADFKKDHDAFMNKFIYKFAKQHVMVQPQVIMITAEKYEDIMKLCCDDSHPQTCFESKSEAFKYSLQTRLNEHRSTCVIHEKYGDNVLMAKKMTQYSQKFPQANRTLIESMIEDINDITDACCEGDMISCMRKRKELVDDLCSDHDMVSREGPLSECCKKHVKERGSCIEMMTASKKPEDLSAHYSLYDNLPEICQRFKERPGKTIGKIIFEISRRHQEASHQVILQQSRFIKDALTMCCGREDVADCYNMTMRSHDMHIRIRSEAKLYKELCEMEKMAGHDEFEISLMVQYTAMMPQASFEQLELVTDMITDVFDHCCTADPQHSIVSCATPKITNIIDIACHDFHPENLNPQIAKCCNESYATRRDCVGNLGPDMNFKSPPVTDNTFHFDASLCDKQQHDLLLARKKLLYDLVRLKTNITMADVKTISTKYHGMRQKCCAEAEKDACFTAEGEKLITDSKKLLGIP